MNRKDELQDLIDDHKIQIEELERELDEIEEQEFEDMFDDIVDADNRQRAEDMNHVYR